VLENLIYLDTKQVAIDRCLATLIFVDRTVADQSANLTRSAVSFLHPESNIEPQQITWCRS